MNEFYAAHSRVETSALQQRYCQCHFRSRRHRPCEDAQHPDRRCVRHGVRFSSFYDPADLQLHGADQQGHHRSRQGSRREQSDRSRKNHFSAHPLRRVKRNRHGLCAGTDLVRHLRPARWGKVLLIGNVIEQEFMQGTNWHLGSGLSVVLMLFVIASMTLMNVLDKDEGGTAVW